MTMALAWLHSPNCAPERLPELGYTKARRLLKERFGDNFVIAELWIDRLTEGGSRADLREYADDLRTCYESLRALGAFEELKSQASLAAIVKKLPTYLQNRWRDVVYELKRGEGRRPDLWDVVLFVQRAADIAADPVYGQPGTRNAKSDRSHQKTSYAASVTTECPICLQEGHVVVECPGYLRQEPDERLQLVVQRQLCFVCLQTGHNYHQELRTEREVWVGGMRTDACYPAPQS